MVSMYPHKLYLVSVSSSRDADGYVESTEGSETLLGQCRLETQGKSSTLLSDDGVQMYTSATIYAPTFVGNIVSGSLICVRDSNGNTLIRKSVINSSVTQLHVRIWV